jgi:hypothetical protein
MSQPRWRHARIVKIPAQPARSALWTVALELVCGPRLLRMTVVEHAQDSSPVPAEWNIEPGVPCSSNGLPAAPAGECLSPNAPPGALVGKLGGSASDFPAGAPPAYAGARVFAVGSQAVIRISADEIGPVYLTMNDAIRSFAGHSGELHVLIEEMDL